MFKRQFFYLVKLRHRVEDVNASASDLNVDWAVLRFNLNKLSRQAFTFDLPNIDVNLYKKALKDLLSSLP